MKMVRLGSLLSIALLPLTLVTASPTAELETRHDKHACISDREAKDLLNTYVSLFTDIRPDVARDLLVPNFQEFSASINFLFGQSPGSVAFPSADAFIKGQVETQKGKPKGHVDIKAMIHNCDTIWFRWIFDQKPVPFFGFDHIYVKRCDDGKWRIKKVYSEFNNAAALYNAGAFPCPAR